MPRNRQQIPWEERAGELLAAATELFLTRGYAGTTMADISAAAGVARGNVYWYFKSKDDIFAAVMDRMLSREIRTLSEELAGADPLTQLVRGLTDMRPYKSVAHRASKHVRARRKRFEPVGAETAELTEQFMIAASTGDMDGLLSLLAPDAIWTADSGGKGPPRLGGPGLGAEKVAMNTTPPRDLLLLRAVVDMFDESDTYLTRAAVIEQRTGLDLDTVQGPSTSQFATAVFEKVVDASDGQIIMVGPPHGQRSPRGWCLAAA